MEIQIKIPFYAKVALVSIGLFAFVYSMYIGKHIIIPIVSSTIVAILLNPIVNFLISKKVNKIIAISFAVVLAVTIVVSFFYIISSQMMMFRETLPQLKAKISQTENDLMLWTSDKLKIRQNKIATWVTQSQNDAIDNISIGDKISEAGRIFWMGILLPVYVFMILYYKNLFLEFIRKLFKVEHHAIVIEVLGSTKKIIQSYIVGLFLEMLIVAVLNSVGLLLLGIQYALILGITGAIINIVPYIGGVIATAVPMLIAFITEDSPTAALLVLIVYIVIQFIDKHFIIPQIVAKRVQLNAMVSIVVVLVGGALWGISGMFLSIPLTAIVKVIFDHIDSLKTWGFLLGNIVPTQSKFSLLKK